VLQVNLPGNSLAEEAVGNGFLLPITRLRSLKTSGATAWQADD
jgi:hypothetical protein